MKCVFCSIETEKNRLWFVIKCVHCSKCFIDIKDSDDVGICDECYISRKNQHIEIEHGSVNLV